MEKALNVWRKNAQVHVNANYNYDVENIAIYQTIAIYRKSRYLFRRYDTVRYIDIENDISIFRYIESSLACTIGVTVHFVRQAVFAATAFYYSLH